MFYLGTITGFIVTAVIAAVLLRRQTARLGSYDRERSAHFRRVTELERELTTAKASSASVRRAAELRSEREFGQYKILLRRADTALAQARAERRKSSMQDAA